MFQLATKFSQTMVEGSFRGGKLFYATPFLSNHIYPVSAHKSIANGCEFDSVEEALADFGIFFFSSRKN